MLVPKPLFSSPALEYIYSPVVESIMRNTVTPILVIGMLWGVSLWAQPITSCPVGPTPSGSTGVLLTEAPEGGEEVSICTLPAGFAPPLVTTAVALTENPNVVPPVLSDLIVFTPAGLITFYSDPSIPTDITADLTQTEAAQNVVTLNGTTYVITSDVTPEPSPEPTPVPEPAAAPFILAALAALIVKYKREHRSTHLGPC